MHLPPAEHVAEVAARVIEAHEAQAAAIAQAAEDARQAAQDGRHGLGEPEGAPVADHG